MNEKKLEFRRQYILGPERITKYKDWKSIKYNSNLIITYHPELELNFINFNDSSLLLLGYILDPYNPDLDNKEILKNMITKSSCLNELIKHLYTKGGRYVLISNFNNEITILNDAAGFRQIFYYIDKKQNIWCSSQPTLIADVFGLNIDKKTKNELWQIDLFSKTSEYWFPGGLTLYKNLYHLIPNHYLNLNNCEINRFWPSNKINNISLKQFIYDTASILQGIMQSAVTRFNLAFGITSGYDTRLLLAASKNFIKDIHFFTHTHKYLNENDPDITIPKKILSDLNLQHHIVYFNETMDADFKRYFEKNTILPRYLKGLNAYAIYQYFNKLNQEMVVSNGEIGGISKTFYKLPSYFHINGKVLAILTKMHGSTFIINGYNKWLKSAGIAKENGINI
ncbi:MAG: hypothetical protein MJB14_17605, partial [Spirochaetes bacterium]|nr:hypothetical protein [Spirochaetota bacterium]